MKKICFIATVPATLKCFVLRMAVYLHENTDWDISFICTDDEEFAKELPEYIHFFPVSMERGISIAGIGAMFKMRKIFKREKFDLIQYTSPNASLYASLAGRLAKIPVRLYCQWGMIYVGFNGIKRTIFKLEEKLVCALSTCIEPDNKSNLAFAYAEKLYPENKGHVIWNGSSCGVDFSKFDISKKQEYREQIRKKYNISEDDFVYGFVGRIKRDKGINELLGAFKKIYEQNSNIYLMILGVDESDSTVDESLFNWSKKCDHVIYTGFTNAAEQHLSAMDVFILPSYREGLPMAVLEAEAMGLPVIVTDIHGMANAVVKDITGLVVKKADKDDLRQAMEYLFSKKQELDKYGRKGREYVQGAFEQQTLFEYIKKDREKLLFNSNDGNIK